MGYVQIGIENGPARSRRFPAHRRAVGAEITSPWRYLQLVLILTCAGIAFGTGAAVRSRIEMTSVAMVWPVPLRLFARVLVGSAATATFALLVVLARVVM